MSWRVGIDSGGTFTDVCLFDDATGKVAVWKVSSTPSDPSTGIHSGLVEGLASVEAKAGAVSFFGHGTTVATNALIQNTGVKTGLLTTEGFEDLLEIGRQRRPHLYDLQADKPEILVQRDLRVGITERVLFDGSVEVAIDEEQLRAGVRRLRDAGVKSVAISFLYGFISPEHEVQARAIVADEFPEAFISVSHEVAPEFREFERLSTTVVNGYLGPVMEGYIRRLSNRLGEAGLSVAPHLTQSNGGVIGFETAAQMPVRTVLSGPSTGVVAAQAIGASAGLPDLITFDMGGTSSDVALLDGGQCRTTGDAIVHGYPIKAPMLDIHTVGAGGGSIAYVDSGGHLKVGPRSAGAFPGPACYGQGNDEPTVTDANVLLQNLNPTHLLAGRMQIDQSLSRAAIQKLADKLGMGLYETADGILSIVTANMAKAIRVISVQRGYDPRDYALAAFGGAGPLHAVRLARELDMPRVLVPRNPGILCAIGLLLTDLRADFAITSLHTLESVDLAVVSEVIERLRQQALDWFNREEVAEADRAVNLSVDMRYAGQNYELSIPLVEGDLEAAIARLRNDFAQAHKRQYGFVADEDPIQLVTFRVEAIGRVRKAQFPASPLVGPDPSAAVIGEREVWSGAVSGFQKHTVYDREKLQPGNRITGPAIVEQMDTTTLLPAGCSANVDAYQNIIVELK